MVKYVKVIFLAGYFLCLNVFAVCSSYLGDATINEVYIDKRGNTLTGGMIEIKILDNTISNTIYDTWSVAVCAQRKQGNRITTECMSEISVSVFDDSSSTWLFLNLNDSQSSFIDFGQGFDIQLKDQTGHVIDYIQVNNFGEQSLSCSINQLPYFYHIPGTQNGTVLIERTPDGVSSWVKYNAASAIPTLGANNDGTAVVDHYQIVHNDSGLTCDTQTVTIRACTNSSNSSCTESTDAVILDLIIQGSQTVTKAGINFTGNTTVSFNYTIAEDVTFSINNATVIPSSSLFCSDASFNNSNCQMTLADAGFRFLSTDSDGSVVGITHQLSGKDSNLGYNNKTIQIQAVEKNTTTGACQTLLTAQPIEFAAECKSPNSCTQALSVEGVDIPTTAATPSSYQAVDVGFDGGDSADIILNYPDAGVLELFARYNLPIDGSPSGNYITGSASFTVRPFGFDIQVTDTALPTANNNPGAENANGTKFIAAGEEFVVTLTAKQWQAVDDSNNDGIPDDGANLSDNTTTANFFGETALLDHALVKPLGGHLPDLSANSFDNFSSGTDNRNLTWHEVGILRFDARLNDNDYFGAGDIQGNVPFVGRFTPHHFKQTVQEHGDLTGECGDWVYTGQLDAASQTMGAIRYQTQPALLITAYAANGLNITQNYTLGNDDINNPDITEDFMKLLPSGISLFNGDSDDGVLNDVDQVGKNGSDLMPLQASWQTGSISEHETINGAVIYTFSDLDHYYYLKNTNSEIAPFTAQIPLKINNIVDTDGITQGANDDLTTALAAGVEVRFGRAVLTNTYGPELSHLTVPFSTQYLTSSGQYVVNADDNCSAVSTLNNKLMVSDIDLGGIMPQAQAVTGTVTSGEFNFIELEPQSANRGAVQLELELAPWLYYDWHLDGNQDSNFDDKPNAVATFGLYRGNDRILQWREITP